MSEQRPRKGVRQGWDEFSAQRPTPSDQQHFISRMCWKCKQQCVVTDGSPCPHCGARIDDITAMPPIWFEEEEDLSFED